MTLLTKLNFFTNVKQKRLSSTLSSELRPYQIECIKTCLEEFKNGVNRQVVSLPVGSGKTVIMSNLIPLIPPPTKKATKVLLLAHRTELLDQAHRQIKRYNPDLVVNIEQGKRKVDIATTDVIIASVPTLGRQNSSRLESYNPSDFKAILIDEAHHAVAESYLSILRHFNQTNLLLWGCTATLTRFDGLGLKAAFDKITYHVDFFKMIEEGYLSEMKVTTVETQIALDRVRLSHQDFNLKDLAKAVNTTARNQVIVGSWLTHAHPDRLSTLVFAVDIDHAHELAKTFREVGVDAQSITSKTNPIERQKILTAFRERKIPVLVNCAILTEGTDIPCVDCIMLARPTRSTTLFQQMFGRGLRLFPGKENCLVIDLVDNFKRSGPGGLITVPTLLGLDPNQLLKDKGILELEKESVKEKEKEEIKYDPNDVKLKVTEYDSLDELITDVSTPQEISTITQNHWIMMGQNKCLLNIMRIGVFILEYEEGLWKGLFKYEDPVKKFYTKTTKIQLEANDLHLAIRAADTWVKNRFQKEMIPNSISRHAAFRKQPMTDAQKNALSRYKIDIPDDLNKGQAIDLLLRIKFGQLSIWRNQKKSMIKQKLLSEQRQSLAVLSRDHIPHI